jgi:hypothetical protein
VLTYSPLKIPKKKQQQVIQGPWTDAQTETLSHITQSLNPPNTVLHSSHGEIVEHNNKRTGREVITVNIM